jgi:competence protein ComGC
MRNLVLRKAGFSMMLVVMLIAIIMVLMVVALPKYIRQKNELDTTVTSSVITTNLSGNKAANEAATQANVKALRVALEVYRKKNQNGFYPTQLNDLVTAGVLKSIPDETVSDVPSNQVTFVTARPEPKRGASGWAYDNETIISPGIDLYVNVTGSDSQGKKYVDY